jgi:glycosyltransferase involved in cell wall biosynthesis
VKPVWSIILPFFNEREHLPLALASLSAQTVPYRLILVDNGSTDTSATYVRRRLAEGFAGGVLVEEPRPGKVAALAAGLRLVDTPYVATCDADTWYPPEYLAEAQHLLETGGPTVHGAGAYFVNDPRSRTSRLMGALHWLSAARLLPRQTHTGGAGQVFRTASLRGAGGFDPMRWPYVLEDHEIGQRLLKLGRVCYGARLWCAPSTRPRNRGPVSWTLVERLVYHATPHGLKDWYFYTFLGPRLAARGLLSHRLRAVPVPEQEPSLVPA